MVKENKLSPTRLYLRLSEGCEDNIKAFSKLEVSTYDHTLQHEILRPHKLSLVSRARTLLNRWCNGDTLANAERLLRLSKLIGKFTQPCIIAANIRTWRNGWVTVRRMRVCQPTRTDQCIFGCSPTAKDSIEHYVHCPILQKAGGRVIEGRSTRTIPRGLALTLLTNDTDNEEDILFRATWVFLYILCL
jgi:hypothetical protein